MSLEGGRSRTRSCTEAASPRSTPDGWFPVAGAHKVSHARPDHRNRHAPPLGGRPGLCARRARGGVASGDGQRTRVRGRRAGKRDRDQILPPSLRFRAGRSRRSVERRDRDRQLHQAAWLGPARPAGHGGLCRGFACHPDAPRRRQRRFLHALRPGAPGADHRRGGRARARRFVARAMEPAPALADSRGRGGRNAVALRGDRRALAADPAGQSRKSAAAGPAPRGEPGMGVDRARQRR